MVLPNSSSFFWPPDKLPASSWVKWLKFKKFITSIAFCLISSSCCFTLALLNKAYDNFSPNWFGGTIIKFSRTVKVENSWAIWKVLRTPLANNSWGFKKEISSLLRIIFPSSGSYNPAIVLNNVVFPAPFGPIKPVMEPISTFIDALWTAFNPPKNLLTLFISSIM